MLQEPFCMEIYRKMPFPNFKTRILRGNLQEKTHMDMSEDPFCVEIYKKNAAHPFQDPHFVWKFTRTLLKNHFVWKFAGKMPPAPVPTSIKHRAFYSYRKKPFSVATLFGEKTHSYGNFPHLIFSTMLQLLLKVWTP